MLWYHLFIDIRHQTHWWNYSRINMCKPFSMRLRSCHLHLWGTLPPFFESLVNETDPIKPAIFQISARSDFDETCTGHRHVILPAAGAAAQRRGRDLRAPPAPRRWMDRDEFQTKWHVCMCMCYQCCHIYIYIYAHICIYNTCIYT